LDLGGGELGRNTFYELYRPGPLRLYYDWKADANGELVEAWEHGGSWLPVRDRTWLARGLPGVEQRFTTHEAYGKATVQTSLALAMRKPKWFEANHLESSIFLNRGSHFERVPLPRKHNLPRSFPLTSEISTETEKKICS